MKTNQKYLWVKGNFDEAFNLKIIDDPMDLFKSGQFNEKEDKLYMLGSEAQLQVSIVPKSNTREVKFPDFQIRGD